MGNNATSRTSIGRAFVFLCLAALLAAPAWTEEPAGGENAEIGPREVLINSLLPGYAQIRMGRVTEGSVYLLSVPLNIAGFVLQTHYLAQVFADPALERFATDEDGQWYAYYLPGLAGQPYKWELYLGTVLGLYGTLLSTHSQYDLINTLSPPPPGRAVISLGEAVLAPWQPRNLLSAEILPVFALSILPDLARISRDDLSAYFARESVPFLSRPVSPAAGLALAAGSAVLIANANAVWEEIMYRGIRLQSDGVAGSSFRFGLVHLPNALMPNTSIQDTLWQGLFATAFGFHAAMVTERAGGDFRKAIAWHFWNNVIAFTLGYLAAPDDQLLFSVGAEFSY
jgi:hypothetical protein